METRRKETAQFGRGVFRTHPPNLLSQSAKDYPHAKLLQAGWLRKQVAVLLRFTVLNRNHTNVVFKNHPTRPDAGLKF